VKRRVKETGAHAGHRNGAISLQREGLGKRPGNGRGRGVFGCKERASSVAETLQEELRPEGEIERAVQRKALRG